MQGGYLSLEIAGGHLATAGDGPMANGQEAAAAWAFSGIFLLLMLILSLGIFGLQIYSCIWAGSDAERRGKSGFLIGLLVFFTWPLGLLIWLLARPEGQMPPIPPAPVLPPSVPPMPPVPPPPVPGADRGR